MTAPLGEQRIGYRSPAVWFWPLFWLIALVLRWLLGWDAAGPLTFWVPGIALLETNALLTSRRARRGLTLTPRGIIWHKYEMFLPWSNVAAVEHRGARLVVRVGEPAQALEDVAVIARVEIRANLRRFGAPIALRARPLGRPAAEIVEVAGRLRAEYEPPAGFKGFMTQDTPPDEERARRSARVWIRLASAGFGVLLFGTVLVNAGSPGSDDAIAFAFRRTTGPGYMDQVLTIENYGWSAVAPTLTFTPLDAADHVLRGVTVRSAYGSDHGLVVLPPRSTGTDVLAFDGPGFRQVADVRVTVRHKEQVGTPRSAVEELHARRMLGTAFTDPPQDFDSLLVENTNTVPVSVRIVCILWEDPPPGATQQMVRSLPIGDLVTLDPFDTAHVPVTGPVRKLARGCGSVKVYYSRPAPAASV